MKPEHGYRPIPVKAAELLAKRYDKSIVIIFAHDPIHGVLHTTTYGRSEQEKHWAALGGEIATKALGGLPDLKTPFEDFRQQYFSGWKGVEPTKDFNLKDLRQAILASGKNLPCDCCPLGGVYNGFASGPILFTCPKNCTCHD